MNLEAKQKPVYYLYLQEKKQPTGFPHLGFHF